MGAPHDRVVRHDAGPRRRPDHRARLQPHGRRVLRHGGPSALPDARRDGRDDPGREEPRRVPAPRRTLRRRPRHLGPRLSARARLRHALRRGAAGHPALGPGPDVRTPRPPGRARGTGPARRRGREDRDAAESGARVWHEGGEAREAGRGGDVGEAADDAAEGIRHVARERHPRAQLVDAADDGRVLPHVGGEGERAVRGRGGAVGGVCAAARRGGRGRDCGIAGGVIWMCEDGVEIENEGLGERSGDCVRDRLSTKNVYAYVYVRPVTSAAGCY